MSSQAITRGSLGMRDGRGFGPRRLENVVLSVQLSPRLSRSHTGDSALTSCPAGDMKLLGMKVLCCCCCFVKNAKSLHFGVVLGVIIVLCFMTLF